MNKILISAGTIVVVAALAIGGTIAFYNDTETSTGNIFTAGSIDLKVDHLAQTYNGADCETCSVNVYSSLSTNVVAASAGASNQGPFPVPAVDVINPHPGWQNEATLSPAQWIWATNPTTVADTTNGAEYTFENKFQWNGSPVSVDLDLAIAADNGYVINLNGTEIVNKLSQEFTYASAVSLSGIEESAFMGAMVNGQNTLHITVRNKPLAADPITGNPAGLLFKLNIQRNSTECESDSAFQRACVLWQSTDLDGSQAFFNFGDIKPSDWGTNLISLHVNSNDAFTCLFPNNITDAENVRIEPEETADDPSDGTTTNGELSQFIKMFAWADDGNGIYEGENAVIPVNTPFNMVDSEIIAMSLSGGGPTGYIGLAWCVGTQSLSGNNILCSGNATGIDQAQTDSTSASLTAYAVQQRNNENFSCKDAFDELFPPVVVAED